MQSSSQSFPPTESLPSTSSLADRIADLVFAPRELFDGLKSSPVRPENWLAPVFLSSLIQVLAVLLDRDLTAKEFRLDSALIVLLSQIFGVFWAGFVFWIIGKFLLRTPFQIHKALEIVGLTQVILGLSTLAALALELATDDPVAKPALSLLFRSAAPGPGTLALLNAFNFFHLWSAALLSLAMASLARVTFAEAAFWIFGYWIGAPFLLALL